MPDRNRAAQQAATQARMTRDRLHHGSGRARGLEPSLAERRQGEVLAGDLELTQRARLLHPAVRWWWGERKIAGAAGAYCYLCDAMIVTWDTRWPMTREAELAILAHRDQVHARR